jgi:hypothetical protein
MNKAFIYIFSNMILYQNHVIKIIVLLLSLLNSLFCIIEMKKELKYIYKKAK